jgi:Arc/MetJ-type ribon-helix-helix transcriptional regulator
MAKVEKVTVSLPASLLKRIEEHRTEGQTRSELVTDWLWRGWREVERERMEEEYDRAYALKPETEEELAWADMAADESFAGDDDDWSEFWRSDSNDTPPEHRAAG